MTNLSKITGFRRLRAARIRIFGPDFLNLQMRHWGIKRMGVLRIKRMGVLRFRKIESNLRLSSSGDFWIMFIVSWCVPFLFFFRWCHHSSNATEAWLKWWGMDQNLHCPFGMRVWDSLVWAVEWTIKILNQPSTSTIKIHGFLSGESSLKIASSGIFADLVKSLRLRSFAGRWILRARAWGLRWGRPVRPGMGFRCLLS
jgi:hypothetical protein